MRACGSPWGYKAHRERGEVACAPCREASARYRAELRWRSGEVTRSSYGRSDRDLRPGGWVDEAACAPERLGGDFLRDLGAAEQVATCAACPVRLECLTYALRAEDGLPMGHRRDLPVYGGLTGDGRLRLALGRAS